MVLIEHTKQEWMSEIGCPYFRKPPYEFPYSMALYENRVPLIPDRFILFLCNNDKLMG